MVASEFISPYLFRVIACAQLHLYLQLQMNERMARKINIDVVSIGVEIALVLFLLHIRPKTPAVDR